MIFSVAASATLLAIILTLYRGIVCRGHATIIEDLEAACGDSLASD